MMKQPNFSVSRVSKKFTYMVVTTLTTLLFLVSAMTAFANPALQDDPVIGLNQANQMEMYFETIQPGMSHVEYGPTDAYGQQTETFVALDRRHTHVLEGLSVDTEYHYQVHLMDWGGDSIIAKEATFTTPSLESPTGVRARGADEEVRLSWEHTFGAVSYKVMRATEAGGPYVVAGTTEDHAFSDSRLENFSDYYYVVHALTTDGQESAASDEVVGTPSPVHPDLVGGWSFEDDKDGVVVADHSLNGHHGELKGGATLVDGRGGQVVSLNGGRVEVPSSPDFNFGAEFTVTIWVKLENVGNNQKIIGRTSIGNGWVLGFEDTMYPEVWDASGKMHEFRHQGPIEPNEWTQLALTWKQGDHLIGYVNGVEVARLEASDEPMANNNSILRMGVAPWDIGAFNVQGEIDEVHLYKSALPADEILRLYQEEADY